MASDSSTVELIVVNQTLVYKDYITTSRLLVAELQTAKL